MNVLSIPLSEICINDKLHFRGNISTTDVISLAKDIKENGLLSPITVRPYKGPKGQPYIIVSGYRRYKAHIVNNATHIDAIIRDDLDDTSAIELYLAENSLVLPYKD